MQKLSLSITTQRVIKQYHDRLLEVVCASLPVEHDSRTPSMIIMAHKHVSGSEMLAKCEASAE